MAFLPHMILGIKNSVIGLKSYIASTKTGYKISGTEYKMKFRVHWSKVLKCQDCFSKAFFFSFTNMVSLIKAETDT